LQSVPHCTATIDRRRSAHTNPKNAFDVNNDGNISPLDVLAIVNFINIKQEKDEEPSLSGETPGNPNYLDVNGDSFADALDALLIINYMNSK
jgi:hypothetical protein